MKKLFQKGHPKVPGSGIKKGQKQKRTQVKEIIEELLGKSMLEEIIGQIKARESLKLNVLLDLMPYCYPRLAATTVEATIEDITEKAADDIAGELESAGTEEVQCFKQSGAI